MRDSYDDDLEDHVDERYSRDLTVARAVNANALRLPGSSTNPGVPDPARASWPPMLPIEIAMRTAPIRRICEAYHITKDEYDELAANPAFREDVRLALEMLKREGMSFKLKAKMQSEELLKTAWKIMHDPAAPYAVRADLIKHTNRLAGLVEDPKVAAAGGTALNIQINLGE